MAVGVGEANTSVAVGEGGDGVAGTRVAGSDEAGGSVIVAEGMGVSVAVDVTVAVAVTDGALVLAGRVGVSSDNNVGSFEGVLCLRSVSGSAVSAGSATSTTLIVAVGPRGTSAATVAGGFVVAVGAAVHVAVAVTGTVPVSRGRFIERSGLIGDAI